MRRVAVLGDVHGNSVALAAVLGDLRQEEVDLVVWTGDISWGWEPEATLELVRSFEVSARYVRGNAERALLELRDGQVETPTEREGWMAAHHTEADLAFVETFEIGLSIDIDGLERRTSATVLRGVTRSC
ncbi:MAG: metallophosphoesterase [Actinobacteria bacterium]|nr:metallophosphoesterase [Actinomycetota bacterium]